MKAFMFAVLAFTGSVASANALAPKYCSQEDGAVIMEALREMETKRFLYRN